MGLLYNTCSISVSPYISALRYSIGQFSVLGIMGLMHGLVSPCRGVRCHIDNTSKRRFGVWSERCEETATLARWVVVAAACSSRVKFDTLNGFDLQLTWPTLPHPDNSVRQHSTLGQE